MPFVSSMSVLVCRFELWKPSRFSSGFMQWMKLLYISSSPLSLPLSLLFFSLLLSVALSFSISTLLPKRRWIFFTRPHLRSFFTPPNSRRTHILTLFLFTSTLSETYTSWENWFQQTHFSFSRPAGVSLINGEPASFLMSYLQADFTQHSSL